MRFALKVAIRFLKSSKGQTILISLGIAVGVSVQIFIGSLIQGLQKSLIDKTIGGSSQITVISANDEPGISDWEEKVAIVANADKRINIVSVVADSSAYAMTENKSFPVVFRGVIFEKANKIYKFPDKLIEGKLPMNENEIIVGKELKEELKLKLNDKLKIFTVKGITKEMKVTGIFDLKVANINRTWVVAKLETSQKLFEFGQRVTSIETQVNKVFAADEIAKTIDAKLEDEVKVLNWKDQNQELLSGLSGQSISSLMIQVFVLIAVILGIASVLAISVLQKSKQLGILKAMGVKDRTASLIFLTQGLILGIIGAMLGILLGLGLAYSFTKFAVNPDGTPVVALFIDMKFIIISGMIAALSATLASLIPAIKSSKLNPMEVIKNG